MVLGSIEPKRTWWSSTLTVEGKITFVVAFQLAVIVTPIVRRLFASRVEANPVSKMELVMMTLNIVVAIPVGLGEMFGFFEDIYFPVAIVLASMLLGTTDHFLRKRK